MPGTGTGRAGSAGERGSRYQAGLWVSACVCVAGSVLVRSTFLRNHVEASATPYHTTTTPQAGRPWSALRLAMEDSMESLVWVRGSKGPRTSRTKTVAVVDPSLVPRAGPLPPANPKYPPGAPASPSGRANRRRAPQRVPGPQLLGGLLVSTLSPARCPKCGFPSPRILTCAEPRYFPGCCFYFEHPPDQKSPPDHTATSPH